MQPHTLIYSVAHGISIIYVKIQRSRDLWISMFTIAMNIDAPTDHSRLQVSRNT